MNVKVINKEKPRVRPMAGGLKTSMAKLLKQSHLRGAVEEREWQRASIQRALEARHEGLRQLAALYREAIKKAKREGVCQDDLKRMEQRLQQLTAETKTLVFTMRRRSN